MTERTLSQPTTSLVRSKSLRLPSKNKDVIQENIRNVSMLSRSGSLRDHKKNKDLVGASGGRDDSSLHGGGSAIFGSSGEPGIARTDRDSIRALSKSCHGSLGSSHSEGARRNGAGGSSLSFRRPFSSRGEPSSVQASASAASRMNARTSPASPTGSTPPPRERCGPELRESRETRTNGGSGSSSSGGGGGNSGSGNVSGRDYAGDLKLLVAEHLKLQQEYARVRQQLVERNAATAIERLERTERSNGLMSSTAGQRSPSGQNSLSELSSIPELEPQLPLQLGGDINNNNGNINHSHISSNSSCSSNGSGKNRDAGTSSVRCCAKRSREEVAVEAYRREVLRLQEELHRMQKLYWNQVILQQKNTRHHHDRDESGRIVVDLLNQLEANRGELLENRSKVRRLEEQLSTSVRETATCRDALRDYQHQLGERASSERMLKRQIVEAMDELREAKEALQFAEDELRSMAMTDPVNNSGAPSLPPPPSPPTKQQQQKQLPPSREKSPDQDSERTPPDGKSHQFAGVNGVHDQPFYNNHIEKENHNGVSNQHICSDSCVDQRRLLQSYHVILELGRQLEAMIREDGRFAEEHLDLSDLELKRVIESDNVIQYSALPSNGEKSMTPTEEVQEIAETAALGWARRTLAVRRALRARLQDKMRTAQEQIVELKNSLDLMCRRHSDCEELVRSLELKLERGRTEVEGLREQMSREQDEHKLELQGLHRQIDELNNRSRSHWYRPEGGVHNGDQQQLHTERTHEDVTSSLGCRHNSMNSSPDINGGTLTVNSAALQRDNLLLKQEISKLRETELSQEELVRAMAAKFHRSQQLWEENYRRTRAELRARDQQVDSVVDVLRGLPDLVGQCAPLHLLFRSLTDPGARPPANKLGVKASGVVASAV